MNITEIENAQCSVAKQPVQAAERAENSSESISVGGCSPRAPARASINATAKEQQGASVSSEIGTQKVPAPDNGDYASSKQPQQPRKAQPEPLEQHPPAAEDSSAAVLVSKQEATSTAQKAPVAGQAGSGQGAAGVKGSATAPALAPVSPADGIAQQRLPTNKPHAPAEAASYSTPAQPQKQAPAGLQTQRPAPGILPDPARPVAVAPQLTSAPNATQQAAAPKASSQAAPAPVKPPAPASAKPTALPGQQSQPGLQAPKVAQAPAAPTEARAQQKVPSEALPKAPLAAVRPAVAAPAKPAPASAQQKKSGGVAQQRVEAPVEATAPAQRKATPAQARPAQDTPPKTVQAPARPTQSRPASEAAPEAAPAATPPSSKAPAHVMPAKESPGKGDSKAASAVHKSASTPAQWKGAAQAAPIVATPAPKQAASVSPDPGVHKSPHKDGGSASKPQRVSRFAGLSKPLPAAPKVQISRPAPMASAAGASARQQHISGQASSHGSESGSRHRGASDVRQDSHSKVCPN